MNMDSELLHARMMCLVHGRPFDIIPDDAGFDCQLVIWSDTRKHHVSLRLRESDFAMNNIMFDQRYIVPALGVLDAIEFPERMKREMWAVKEYANLAIEAMRNA